MAKGKQTTKPRTKAKPKMQKTGTKTRAIKKTPAKRGPKPYLTQSFMTSVTSAQLKALSKLATKQKVSRAEVVRRSIMKDPDVLGVIECEHSWAKIGKIRESVGSNGEPIFEVQQRCGKCGQTESRKLELV